MGNEEGNCEKGQQEKMQSNSESPELLNLAFCFNRWDNIRSLLWLHQILY